MSRTYSGRRFTVAIILYCLLLAACGGSGTPTPAPIVPYKSAAPASCHANGPLPDTAPACTPGATNPAVTQDTIKQTICVVGWTATIRPPVSVTDPIKVERMAAYGYANLSKNTNELDHLISLELGGATQDVRNLWPELYVTPGTNPNRGAHEKDKVENFLKAQVCNGSMTLAMAQQEIVSNWVAVYENMQRSGLVQLEPPNAPTATPVE